jgi:Zn-dependent protease with chaperone function
MAATEMKPDRRCLKPRPHPWVRLVRIRFWLACVMTVLSAYPAMAQEGGVSVRKPSQLSKLVPAAELEQAAAQQYEKLKQESRAKGILAGGGDPELLRVRAVAQRIMPFAAKWNPRAANWKWEINLLRSPEVNAFCMPGGKIAFYTGILEKMKLSDDEIGIVMGHEMSHALREHSRARVAQQAATSLGANLLSQLFGLGNVGNAVLGASVNLLGLRFSREDETEADAVGLELAARAGYDPRAGVTLWQKMQAGQQGAPPEWISSHPTDGNRVEEIKRHLPEVMPLYEQARRR